MSRWSIPALLLALSVTSCDRDDAGPSVSPTIGFITDDGYTYQGDTVPMSDTLLVGVRVQKGGDGLKTFKVISAYDGGAEVVQDSLAIGSPSFGMDKTIITRPVAGTEKWTFWVQETDGDVFRRSLTFTVR